MNGAVLQELSGELAARLAKPPEGPSILELAHGIHDGVPAEQYYRRVFGVASKSGLDLVRRAPALYKAWCDGLELEETAALRFGTALHTAILEPDRFARVYVAEPDFGDCRKKENKARRDAWRAENAHATALDADDAARIAGMRESLMRHALVRKLVENARREVTAKWTDRPTGIISKSRWDLWLDPIGTIADLKSTEDASPDAFKRSVAKWGYHRQHSMYEDGGRACGADVRNFAFIAAEKAPPYLVAVYNLDEQAVNKGREEIERLFRTLAECVESGIWPGYPAGITSLSLPRWYGE